MTIELMEEAKKRAEIVERRSQLEERIFSISLEALQKHGDECMFEGGYGVKSQINSKGIEAKVNWSLANWKNGSIVSISFESDVLTRTLMVISGDKKTSMVLDCTGDEFDRIIEPRWRRTISKRMGAFNGRRPTLDDLEQFSNLVDYMRGLVKDRKGEEAPMLIGGVFV